VCGEIEMTPAKSRNLAYIWANVGFTLFALNFVWSGFLMNNYLTSNDPLWVFPNSFLLLIMCSVLIGVLLGTSIGMSMPSDQHSDPEVVALLTKHRAYGSTPA
jgi:hypothetical protein